jgi:hypothetical protein
MTKILYGIKVFDVDVYSTYLHIEKFLDSRKLFPVILSAIKTGTSAHCRKFGD